jgi:hypothetical protein
MTESPSKTPTEVLVEMRGGAADVTVIGDDEPAIYTFDWDEYNELDESEQKDRLEATLAWPPEFREYILETAGVEDHSEDDEEDA